MILGGHDVKVEEVFGVCGVVLLFGRSILHRHRTTGGSAVFLAADTDNNRAFMADSVFIGREIVFASAFTELANGLCVVCGVSTIFYVDISAAMVHVANLLWFCSRDGDFYIFGERDDTFALAADNLRFEPIFFADTADWADILLHDVALFIASVTYGDLSDELAWGDWIYSGDDRVSYSRADFFIAWNGFEIFL